MFVFVLFWGGTVLLASVFFFADCQRDADKRKIELTRAMVSELGLTDLCLFSKACYTKKPSQTDLFSVFQEHSGIFGALSGSFLWLIINFADNQAYDYPLLKKKYAMLIVLVPFIAEEPSAGPLL